jgi:hypothetical protein
MLPGRMPAPDPLSFLPPVLARAVAGYPPWLVVVAGAAAVLLVLWILGKLLKWTLYLVLIALAAACVIVAAWMVLNALHLVPVHPSVP